VNLPLSESDIAFEQFLQELPEDYEQLAREFKAFCRARKIKTPAELMRVVMSYCGLDQVLREVAGTFTLLEEAISDTAIHKRLKACLPWVKALLTQMMGEGIERLIKGHLRLIIIDGSTVQGPGAIETWYRLHIAIDLVKLHLIHVEVTDKHQGERLDYYPLQDGDVVLIDRGYNQPAQLVEQGAKGVHVVLRYNPHSMTLYDGQGQKIDWYQRLNKDCSEATCCVPARVVHEGECLEGWVQASRLPQEQAAQARRRVRAKAKKRGRTAQAKTLLLAGWVLVFTTVAPEILPTAVIAELYRVRWQVELAIKRLKSLLDVDQLRAREGSALAQLYLHGKLLYAWVVERRARRRCGEACMRLDGPRQATWWRVWKLIKQEVAIMISGVRQWNFARWEQCLAVMQERPRRRTLQTLPDRVNRLIASCQAAGLSNI
jgi:hypothetical protein